MKTSLLLGVIGLSLVYGADHGTFKDCGRVDFCSQLRNKEQNNQYYVDSWDKDLVGQDILQISLKSETGAPSLTAEITAHDPSTFRIKINEEQPFRYELKDVLPSEPANARLDDVLEQDDVVHLTAGPYRVAVHFSPFSIEFQGHNTTRVVLNGNDLVLNKNDNNAPFAFGVKFPEAVQLYGVHEHCDTLALRNTAGGSEPYRLKNSDVAYYEVNSPMALYGAVPVIYGHGPSSTSGIFLHNAAEQWIDVSNNNDGSGVYFMAETGSLDLFVFLGPTPTEVVRQYTALTGTAHLPQLWSLGYHQSRYSYDTQDDVKSVISNFDSHDFPLDAIWLDIDYSDGFKYFTWNPNTFSDPIGLQETIASTNKHLVTIIDPHIKVESGYSVYDGALANNLFVRNADGSVFQGPCWPGTSSYMDFLNPAARQYYGDMYSYDNFKGSTPTIGGIWNDMNEPSVFDTSLEMTLPADALHIGDVRHKEIHNIYGFLHTKATHQGLLARDSNSVRPFVLTRSHFAGSQRYAAVWTGDNTADWPYLLASYQECLNANILGIVFCGADVGGFFNNPTNELFERWYQAGAWLTFYRAHSEKTTQRREPYLMPDDTQEVVRNALHTRYQHIPVWYTLFYEHTVSGDPVIRPLFYEYPQEVGTYSIDTQLLLGRDILVRGVFEPGVSAVDVYFPGGENEVWLSLFDDSVQAGTGSVNVPLTRDNIPVYYRQGGVIVRKDAVRLNTAEAANDPHTLYYTVDKNNRAYGTVYLDDGISFQYENVQDYNYFTIEVEGENVSITPAGGNGNYVFVVDKVIRRDIVAHPESGKPGKYKETVITTDANGTLLKEIKINQKTVLKLK